MKRFLIILVVALLGSLFIGSSAYAGRTAKLLDKTYKAAECQVLCANPAQCSVALCKDVDSGSFGFEKTFSEELGVFPSGEIAVYIGKTQGGDAPYGGFDPLEDLVFVPDSSSDAKVVGEGLQVFESGRLLLNLTQPYDDLFRRAMDFRVIVYFYAHTQDQISNFRRLRIDDSRAFEQFKIDNERNIDNLCGELENQPGAPNACVSGTVRRTRVTQESGNYYRNQVETNKQKPRATLDTDRIFAFTRQPIDIKVLSVEDPDGQCDQYRYLWDTTSGSSFNFVVDDLGNASFVPSSPVDSTIRFRIQEDCQGHTLISDPTFIDIRITDRTTLFPDLSASHPYREFLFDLYNLGVVQGYPDGTVKPDRLVSRAEFVKMLFETAQVEVPPTAFSYAFPDVVDGEWYAPYVHHAKNLNIVEGYPDNYYRPNSPVNLVEALKIMLQVTDIEAKENLDIWFGDVDPTDWFSRYVTTAYREGILDDVEPRQNVYPGRLLTRGEVAKLLVRAFISPVNRLNQVNIDKRP